MLHGPGSMDTVWGEASQFVAAARGRAGFNGFLNLLGISFSSHTSSVFRSSDRPGTGWPGEPAQSGHVSDKPSTPLCERRYRVYVV